MGSEPFSEFVILHFSEPRGDYTFVYGPDMSVYNNTRGQPALAKILKVTYQYHSAVGPNKYLYKFARWEVG